MGNKPRPGRRESTEAAGRLETLTVRTREPDARQTALAVQRFMDSVAAPPDLAGYRIYTGGNRKNELMLVLEWTSPPTYPPESGLADNLIFWLKQRGLVDFSVWKPLDNSQLGMEKQK